MIVNGEEGARMSQRLPGDAREEKVSIHSGVLRAKKKDPDDSIVDLIRYCLYYISYISRFHSLIKIKEM